MQQHDWGVSEALRYRFTKSCWESLVSYDVRLPTDAELIGDGCIAPSGDLKREKELTYRIDVR